MASKPITIIGGGLAGLTLGVCLKSRGIAAVIYDRHREAPQSNYGINLHRSTYLHLLPHLGIDEQTFRDSCAINTTVKSKARKVVYGSDPLRVHRGRLEKLLRADLAVQWNKKLANVELDGEKQSIVAVFDDGQRLEAETLVGCDGPHSTVRKSLCSKSKLNVLPYLVVNGTRRVSLDEYKETFANVFPPARTLLEAGHTVRLEVTVNDVTDDCAYLSDTYSRAVTKHDDPNIHESNRSNADATQMPQAFLDDIYPWSFIFFPFQNVFEDNIRRLHWLMRTVRPNEDEIVNLADNNVLLIGDAIHAEPIIGGEGANNAMTDAMELAEAIAMFGNTRHDEFISFKYKEWVRSLNKSEKKLAAIHTESGFDEYEGLP